MRERDDDRLVMVVPRFEIVESRRFWIAPSELRRLFTVCRALSSVASGLAEALPVRVEAVTPVVFSVNDAVAPVVLVVEFGFSATYMVMAEPLVAVVMPWFFSA